MQKLKNLNPERVFHYFEEICKIPRGSENTDRIAEYCVEFANKHRLRVNRDEVNNIVIFKNGSAGYETSEPVILQGHLDMVCQKTPESTIDFLKDGIDIYVEGNLIRAKNTSLGADNGIAIAMILAVLESDTICHPPIEAVFTTDEEIGLIGAGKLDCSVLSAKRMINLDSGESDKITTSCAGGSDFKITLPIEYRKASGKKVLFTIKGLTGGHSGADIDKGRLNANILAGRFLNYAKKVCEFGIISINGGDKANAITPNCEIELVVNDTEEFISKLEDYYAVVKSEIEEFEPDFSISIRVAEEGNFDTFDKDNADKLIYMLALSPNGIVTMSKKFLNLVETSLNLGVLRTKGDKVTLHYALRSNKKTAMEYLEEKLTTFASFNNCNVEIWGHYPAWEFKEDSKLQEEILAVYKELYKETPDVAAIHAGLECGIFSAKIENLDCISIGPNMRGLHSVNEELSISSTEKIYNILLKLLSNLK